MILIGYFNSLQALAELEAVSAQDRASAEKARRDTERLESAVWELEQALRDATVDVSSF